MHLERHNLSTSSFLICELRVRVMFKAVPRSKGENAGEILSRRRKLRGAVKPGLEVVPSVMEFPFWSHNSCFWVPQDLRRITNQLTSWAYTEVLLGSSVIWGKRKFFFVAAVVLSHGSPHLSNRAPAELPRLSSNLWTFCLNLPGVKLQEPLSPGKVTGFSVYLVLVFAVVVFYSPCCGWNLGVFAHLAVPLQPSYIPSPRDGLVRTIMLPSRQQLPNAET